MTTSASAPGRAGTMTATALFRPSLPWMADWRVGLAIAGKYACLRRVRPMRNVARRGIKIKQIGQ